MGIADDIEASITKVLPSLNVELIQETARRLVDDVGVAEISDLAFVESSDLEGRLKPIQIRKLQAKWKESPGHSTDCTNAAETRPKAELASPNVIEPKEFDKSFKTSFSRLDRELRVALIGKTGSGKSATGNTILGYKHFKEFGSATSVTSKCTSKTGQRFGTNVVLVDTPGLFDTSRENEEAQKAIIKCIGLTSPGPHALILVCKVGRFTDEEQKTVQYFIDKLGESVLNYMFVLFTGKDDLVYNKQTFEDYLSKLPPSLTNLLEKCGKRCIAFNNRATGEESEQQVEELLDKITEMVLQNGGNAYTNKIYREAEIQLQLNMQKHKKKLEAEKEREKKQIEENLKKQYEKERTASEDEKIKLQVKIKKEQDNLKKLQEKYESKMSDEALRTSEREDIENESGFWWSIGKAIVKNIPFVSLAHGVGKAVAEYATK